MIKPTVSIYCLTYNHEKYITDALEGFIRQKTNFPFEVIVHDDASTDNTAKIIKRYADKYPDIIKPIFQKENQHSKGVSITEKFIFPIIKGKYIALCEGDDYWIDENKLQIQYDFLENNSSYSGCVHNTYMLNVKKNTKKSMYHHNQDYDIFFSDVVEGNAKVFQTSSVMYRTEYAIDRPVFFHVNTKVGDYPLALYLTLDKKIRYINKTMSVYRIFTEGSWSSANLSTNNFINTLELDNKLLLSVNEFSHNKYNDVIKKTIKKNTYLINEYKKNYALLRTSEYKNIWKDSDINFRLHRWAFRYFGNLVVTLKKYLRR